MTLTNELVDMIGIAAGTLTTMSFLPQLVTVYRTRSAEDLSYTYLSMFALGVILWLFYGIILHAFPIILANAVTLTLVVSIMALKVYYDRHQKVEK